MAGLLIHTYLAASHCQIIPAPILLRRSSTHIFHPEGGFGMIANVLIREDSLSSKEISFQVKLTDKSRPAAAAQPD